MKKKSQFLVAVLLLFLNFSLFAQQYYNYNTAGSSNTFPFGTLPATGKTIQTLYLPGDFDHPSAVTAGNITKVYFRANNTTSATYTNIKIRMGLTTDTDLPSNGWYTGPMTVVYDQANVTLNSTAASFFSITLQTPFSFDPAKSLVIEIEQCGYTGTGISALTTSTTGNKRNTSLQSTPPPTACPHAWLNTGAFIMHTGIDVEPPVVNCSYSWTNQTSGVTNLLYSVKAVNDQVCWTAGAGATIRKTTDGGTTWVNGNPNPGVVTGDIYNIEAIDANTAWCTTTPGATFIYKTTNGGTNWTQVYTLAGGFINAIKMTSPTVGIATGDPVAGNWTILGTTDGGSTWNSISTTAGTGDGRNNCLQVMLPHVWFGTGQGTIWHSTNAGVNWTGVTTTSLAGQVLAVRFNSLTLGLGAGLTMVKSTDAGATYAALPASGTGNITGIQGSGQDFWYTRGTGIFRSTDGGTTWTQVHTAAGTQNDISLASGTNGCFVAWSVGATGTISKMTGVPTGVTIGSNEIPVQYSLDQNYPNPFNPVTNFKFSIPQSGNVTLKVYDALGKEVAVIVNEYKTAGTYRVDFDASALSSGVYFYTINTGGFTQTKKMMLIK